MYYMVYYLYPEHFAYVLYVGFYAHRNLCDKQNVLFYGHPYNFNDIIDADKKFLRNTKISIFL